LGEEVGGLRGGVKMMLSFLVSANGSFICAVVDGRVAKRIVDDRGWWVEGGCGWLCGGCPGWLYGGEQKRPGIPVTFILVACFVSGLR
jgi:hypothetical protein